MAFLKMAEFMLGSILHKIVTKHGLSLGEKAVSSKLDINDDLSECKEIFTNEITQILEI